MMEVYGCCICGGSHLGSDKPSYCPFCNVPKSYMVLAKDLQEFISLNLSEVSKVNLERALLMEHNNTLFYRCAHEVAMTAEFSAIFEMLSKIEAKHASILREILDLPKPIEEEDNRGRCHALEMTNINEAHDREKSAIGFYTKATEMAVEPRIKEIFMALAEAERSHMNLIAKTLEGITCAVKSSII